ncbi:hypothetical protein [Pseudanabaena minima]|uniref:hypothetical protein n=1 Tax=Pseudanabaena minima TaxID=890415 RepID=UPI003DA87E65
MSQKKSNAQLVIKRYEENKKTFAHCLICSTAPINAESQYREDLTSKVSLDSSYPIADIKLVLLNFIKAKWGESGKDVLNKISIVLDIHGFNVPFKNLEENTYEPLAKKFKDDVAKKNIEDFEDFVLFINFSWSSEPIIKSKLIKWIEPLQAMPVMLWIFIIAGISTAFFLSNPLSSLALILVGMVVCLIFLRLAVYFRDRDRAANYGVFDAVELVRWMQVILDEILLELDPQAKERLKLCPDFYGRANLSFIAHSVGCFVATHTIRVLSDVFDQSAIKRWKQKSPDGPFGENSKPIASLTKDEEIQNLGDFFRLKTLVIASPDIPIWAITTGRTNFLQSCLHRFKEVYLFTNDADMILRLASTAANFFMFPSASRVGGYRLGNLTITQERRYGVLSYGNDAIGIRGLTHTIPLKDDPFNCEVDISKSFTIIDCTDYKDKLVGSHPSASSSRRLSAFTANNSFATFFNYILTAFKHFSGISQIDSHGGYFRGEFCRDLIYSLALYGKEKTQKKSQVIEENWEQKFKDHQMAWIEANDDRDCNATEK